MSGFTVQQTSKLNLDDDLPVRAEVEESLDELARYRAAAMSKDMTEALHEAADEALLQKKLEGVVPQVLSDMVKDAAHSEFEARTVPPPIVAGVQARQFMVALRREPTPSGKPQDLVGRAFEFGSHALQTPATNFTRDVVEKHSREVGKDMEELARQL